MLTIWIENSVPRQTMAGLKTNRVAALVKKLLQRARDCLHVARSAGCMWLGPAVFPQDQSSSLCREQPLYGV